MPSCADFAPTKVAHGLFSSFEPTQENRWKQCSSGQIPIRSTTPSLIFAIRPSTYLQLTLLFTDLLWTPGLDNRNGEFQTQRVRVAEPCSGPARPKVVLLSDNRFARRTGTNDQAVYIPWADAAMMVEQVKHHPECLTIRSNTGPE